jgi:hypothetical protein
LDTARDSRGRTLFIGRFSDLTKARVLYQVGHSPKTQKQKRRKDEKKKTKKSTYPPPKERGERKKEMEGKSGKGREEFFFL